MKDFQNEITPIAEDDLFIVLNHPNAKFDYPVHYHPDYEINLVLNRVFDSLMKKKFVNN